LPTKLLNFRGSGAVAAVIIYTLKVKITVPLIILIGNLAQDFYLKK
jgi:hypothetical protein